ncbi:MAG: endonuclease/exonuclease/phosphatase family protein [Pseudomonadales bacterium]
MHVESVSIADIQGEGYFSPLNEQAVVTRGVVIAHSRRGFFIQDPAGKPNAATSCGLFALSRKKRPAIGSFCEVEGLVIDYLPSEFDRPVTELKVADVTVLSSEATHIEPVWLSAASMPNDAGDLANFLNGLEGMCVGVKEGATFIAPSNPFADYVLAPHDSGSDLLRSEQGGVLIDADQSDRWFPGFRLVDYNDALSVDVGAVLLEPVIGALNYRSASWQMAVNSAVKVEAAPTFEPNRTNLEAYSDGMTVMTLNALNLDIKIEEAGKVIDPRRDIDDDVGEGRFLRLARAIVRQARNPDIVALQEIQDNDGAELSDVVDASLTYKALIADVLSLGGPEYNWLDIAPKVGADGGQPGGNIRNGFLYNPQRVSVLNGTVRLLAADNSAYEDSRKPLTATFYLNQRPGYQLTIINVHLASKRHQRGVFSPDKPGFDPKEPTRIEQAKLIREVLAALDGLGRDYFVTGDFNDNEFSATLKTLLGDGSVNLVEQLPPNQRFDYNHRGKLQVLMHGVVAKAQLEQGRAEYEILHGNELLGVRPGDGGGKASDHAYTIARLRAPE